MHELLLFKTSDKFVGGTDTILLLWMFKTLHNKKLKGICNNHIYNIEDKLLREGRE